MSISRDPRIRSWSQCGGRRRPGPAVTCRTQPTAPRWWLSRLPYLDARATNDDRPPLVVLAACLDNSASRFPTTSCRTRRWSRSCRCDRRRPLAAAARDARTKSESALVAYRVAIDDLLDWSETARRNVLDEPAIVDYLRLYQERAHPAPATYYRRFLLIRRFLRWVCRRTALPTRSSTSSRRQAAAGARLVDPRGVPPPARRRGPSRAEPARSRRARPARADRSRHDRTSSLRAAARSNGATSSSTAAGGRCSSARGKGGKPRRQPVPAGLARELRTLRESRATRADGSGLLRTRRRDAFKRRSSPTSSAAPRRAPGSTSTSPRTRFAIPRRRGCVRSSATRASSPSTSATPTSRPSRVTRTSNVRNSSMLQEGWRPCRVLRKALTHRRRHRRSRRRGRSRRVCGACRERRRRRRPHRRRGRR